MRQEARLAAGAIVTRRRDRGRTAHDARHHDRSDAPLREAPDARAVHAPVVIGLQLLKGLPAVQTDRHNVLQSRLPYDTTAFSFFNGEKLGTGGV